MVLKGHLLLLAQLHLLVAVMGEKIVLLAALADRGVALERLRAAQTLAVLELLDKAMLEELA
jgi:hypothetical protein